MAIPWFRPGAGQQKTTGVSDPWPQAIPIQRMLGVDRRTHNEHSRGEFNSSSHLFVRLLLQNFARECNREKSKVNWQLGRKTALCLLLANSIHNGIAKTGFGE
jgi:hypothetical protein